MSPQSPIIGIFSGKYCAHLNMALKRAKTFRGPTAAMFTATMPSVRKISVNPDQASAKFLQEMAEDLPMGSTCVPWS